MSERRPWESFHATWCSTLADHLNTSRQANLHNELAQLLDLPPELAMPGPAFLYAVAYRPLRGAGQEWIDTWPVGQELPPPLSLSADCCLAVDLETSYRDACQRRRLQEIIL